MATVPPVSIVQIVQVPTNWRGVFDAIRAQQWSSAQAGIAALGPGPLAPVAKAELYTARNSPRVELPQLLALLAEAPDLPQAEQLLRMAVARGAVDSELPFVAPARRLVPLGEAPRRTRAQPVSGDPVADTLRAQMDPLIKADAAAEAELLLGQNAPLLTPEGRAEAAQRVAWAYYVVGRDADSRRVADTYRAGSVGPWRAHAAWISGLAAWRMNDCNAASIAFREVAEATREQELVAAAYYWAARAEQACRRPRSVAPLLKAAAQSPESFYGLVARETLGMDRQLPPLNLPPASRVESQPNIQRALRLAEIGEYRLADEMIRHQARIGNPADHLALIAFTRKINFGGVQYWLAHNGPAGVTIPALARYPLPNWAPDRGWRIEPALAFAHARQESDFRPGAISPAGAVGLMQVRPGTAGDFARQRGIGVGDLTVPSTNLEYGQSFIELMRGNPATQGQLIKVMAAYNAGPVPVSRWNYINDKGDPLLWIESLPYWETRYYVPTVLRNMWVYETLQQRGSQSLLQLAQHHWPAFPVRSPTAVR
ncbi:MAG TPA: lytic transglycosylase domain-containing protein [Sphingomicrobium sp.]|nr:lytic transglycosylase domain-containing protein [Sphingomicrobium sp.]